MNLLLPTLTWDSKSGGSKSGCQSLGLSSSAWSKITFLETPVCYDCGVPFSYDQGDFAKCPACVTQKRSYRLRAACLYDEASRDLILRFKHGDSPDLGRFFSYWLERAGVDLLHQSEVIIPVPLHPKRLFSRGYNQAAEMARPLAKRLHMDYYPDLLQRRRHTLRQGSQNRWKNVAGAFFIPPHFLPLIQGRCVVLIDDVVTTGATITSCTHTLLRAGAKAVNVLAIARTIDQIRFYP